MIRPKLEVTPIGFIHGLNNEIPLLMSFHDRFSRGSLLTVCWSSGVVSYIPLEFDSKANQSMYMSGTPRSLTSFCVVSPNLKNPLNPNSTPHKRTPFSESKGIHFHPNNSVLSPKRPLLFTTISKPDFNSFEWIKFKSNILKLFNIYRNFNYNKFLIFNSNLKF